VSPSVNVIVPDISAMPVPEIIMVKDVRGALSGVNVKMLPVSATVPLLFLFPGLIVRT